MQDNEDPLTRETIEDRLLGGDPDAIGEVLRWIAVMLATPRFWMLRSEWLELQQESMVRVLEGLRSGRFDRSRDFRPYVQSIARYTALQALEQRIKSEPISVADDTFVSQNAKSEEDLISIHLIRGTLDQLSVECRGLIRAYFLEGRSYSEIASSLDLPVGTVKSRLFRCLESACRIIQNRKNRPIRGRTRPAPSKPENFEP